MIKTVKRVLALTLAILMMAQSGLVSPGIVREIFAEESTAGIEWTVSFLDGEGDVLLNLSVQDGDPIPVFPETPQAPDHMVFAGWRIDYGPGRGSIYAEGTPVKGDMELSAYIVPVVHSVIFTDFDGNVLRTAVVPYGSTVSALPAAPEVEGYTFDRWVIEAGPGTGSEFTAETRVTGDMEIGARYTEAPAPVPAAVYTVTFIDDAGVLSTVEVEEGSAVGSLPAPRAKEGYRFSGWAVGDVYFTADTVITADTVVRALYVKEVKADTTWTVTFTDSQGTLQTVTVDDGSTVPALPAAREGSNEIFDKWMSGDSEFTTSTIVTGNMQVEAAYTEAWVVTFRTRDGEAVASTKKVPKGTAIGSMPEPQEREDYTAYWVIATYHPAQGGVQAYWEEGTEEITESYVVNSDIDLMPHYTEISYTVTFFENETDTEPMATRTVSVSTSYCLNDMPQVPVRNGYTGKWVYSGGAFDNHVVIRQDTRVWAEYEQTAFTVTYIVEGETYETNTFYKGDHLTFPADPVVDGKEFIGWFESMEEDADEYTTDTVVNSNLEVYAQFKDQYRVTFVVLDDNGQPIDTLSQYFDVEKGEAISVMPQDPFVEGKVFLRWVVQGSDPEVEVTADTVVNESFTAVAVFREVKVYKITSEYYYITDSNEEYIFNTDLHYIEEGQIPYTITAPSSTQTEEDKVEGSPIYYPSSQSITVTDAMFDANRECTIRFQYVPYTATYSFVYMLKDLTGDGYTQIERQDDVHGVLNSYVTPTIRDYAYAELDHVESGEVTQATGQEFHVYYTRKNFALSYETNGGSYVQGSTVPYGTTVNLPSTNPTRNGYTFAGWYSDAALTQQVTGSVTVNENTTLYAKWTGNRVNYTIIYMKEQYVSGTTAGGNMVTTWVYENSATAQATVGTTVYAASAPNYGTTLNGYERTSGAGSVNGTTTSAGTGDATAVEIQADGSAVLKVYYSLIRYTLVFNINRDTGRITMNGQTYTGSNYRVVGVVLGQDVSSMWPAQSSEIYDTGSQHFRYWTGASANYVTKRYELISDNVTGANANNGYTQT